MSNDVNVLQGFEAAISKLDHTAGDCRNNIADIRRLMHAACDRGDISIHQWRTMMEALGEVQAKCAVVNPNAGWNLPKSRSLAEGRKA